MYFQCAPDAVPNAMSEAGVGSAAGARARHRFERGPDLPDRDVLRFRSFVARELRHGRAALVGDAAHTVPPTGAKGMNLAIADVMILADALHAMFGETRTRLIDAYAETASRRIWKAQNFSWWMTSMLHKLPEHNESDERRQLGELRSVVESEAGRTYLTEAYTGWTL